MCLSKSIMAIFIQFEKIQVILIKINLEMLLLNIVFKNLLQNCREHLFSFVLLVVNLLKLENCINCCKYYRRSFLSNHFFLRVTSNAKNVFAFLSSSNRSQASNRSSSSMSGIACRAPTALSIVT